VASSPHLSHREREGLYEGWRGERGKERREKRRDDEER
jgi:hypothetical protein